MKNILFCFFLTALAGCSSNDKTKSFYLDWPCDIKKISRNWSSAHDGMDIAVPTGSSVYSAHEGVVITAQTSSTYGHYIIVEFSDQWATLYAHLSRMLVQRGDRVGRRQKIALSGSTGESQSPHLHFELIKNKMPVNPRRYLK